MIVTGKAKLKMPVSAQYLATHAPKLQNISRIAESLETQKDFLTRIYEGISGRFPDLSFAMSRASVNSDRSLLTFKE